MKHRLSSVAAVTFAAVLSALVMTVHPAQAQTCATVEVQNLRPDQGMLMVAAYADAASFNKAPVAALQMRANGRPNRRPILGIEQPEKRARMVLQFGVGVAQHFFPARAEVAVAGLQIPVPDAVVAGLHQ